MRSHLHALWLICALSSIASAISHPTPAIVAAVLYTAIMGIGMFYMKTFLGITSGQPQSVCFNGTGSDLSLQYHCGHPRSRQNLVKLS